MTAALTGPMPGILLTPPQPPTRRKFALFPLALASVALLPGTARALTSALPASASLAEELSAALQISHPLLVMVSLAGCPYCKIVRQNYLAPLRSETGQPMVQIDMGSAAAIRNFQGALTTQGAQVGAWNVNVAPTLLFFGKGGRESAARLVGFSSPDFYGAYLEQRLRDATGATR